MPTMPFMMPGKPRRTFKPISQRGKTDPENENTPEEMNEEESQETPQMEDSKPTDMEGETAEDEIMETPEEEKTEMQENPIIRMAEALDDMELRELYEYCKMRLEGDEFVSELDKLR